MTLAIWTVNKHKQNEQKLYIFFISTPQHFKPRSELELVFIQTGMKIDPNNQTSYKSQDNGGRWLKIEVSP